MCGFVYFICSPCTFFSFFLVYAAHVVVLGLTGRLRAQNEIGHSPWKSPDQSMEIAALDAAVKVLEFCGQRNMFARKYCLLIRELWAQLDEALSNSGRSLVTPPPTSFSASPCNTYEASAMPGSSSSGPTLGDEPARSMGSSRHPYANPENFSRQQIEVNRFLPNEDPRHQTMLEGTFDSMTFEMPWTEQPNGGDRASGLFTSGRFFFGNLSFEANRCTRFAGRTARSQQIHIPRAYLGIVYGFVQCRHYH